jgi:hypothetical protein
LTNLVGTFRKDRTFTEDEVSDRILFELTGPVDPTKVR